MKKALSILLFFIVSYSPLVAHSDDNSVVFETRSLSLELASKAVWSAVAECRKRGFSVGVVVVDRGGNIQAALRDRFAGPHTLDTAYRKAWTANSFRQSTGDLATLWEQQNIPSQIPQISNALLVGGGRLIEAAGSVLGSIGVSGAPPGKSEIDSIDGACAQAGLESIDEELMFVE